MRWICEEEVYLLGNIQRFQDGAVYLSFFERCFMPSLDELATLGNWSSRRNSILEILWNCNDVLIWIKANSGWRSWPYWSFWDLRWRFGVLCCWNARWKLNLQFDFSMMMQTTDLQIKQSVVRTKIVSNRKTSYRLHYADLSKAPVLLELLRPAYSRRFVQVRCEQQPWEKMKKVEWDEFVSSLC